MICFSIHCLKFKKNCLFETNGVNPCLQIISMLTGIKLNNEVSICLYFVTHSKSNPPTPINLLIGWFLLNYLYESDNKIDDGFPIMFRCRKLCNDMKIFAYKIILVVATINDVLTCKSYFHSFDVKFHIRNIFLFILDICHHVFWTFSFLQHDYIIIIW